MPIITGKTSTHDNSQEKPLATRKKLAPTPSLNIAQFTYFLLRLSTKIICSVGVELPHPQITGDSLEKQSLASSVCSSRNVNALACVYVSLSLSRSLAHTHTHTHTYTAKLVSL